MKIRGVMLRSKLDCFAVGSANQEGMQQASRPPGRKPERLGFWWNPLIVSLEKGELAQWVKSLLDRFVDFLGTGLSVGKPFHVASHGAGGDSLIFQKG